VTPRAATDVSGIAVRGAYAALMTSEMQGSHHADATYQLTIYRTRDAKAIAQATGQGHIRVVDVLDGGGFGVVTDRGADLRSIGDEPTPR
jgi:hypothetical protein